MSQVRDTAWLRDTMFALSRVFFPEDDFEDTHKIGWIPAWERRGRKDDFWGLYCRENKVITLHPVLAWDVVPGLDLEIPDYVPTGIIYHELCHAKLTNEHDALFNASLRLYPYDRDMELWIAHNCAQLDGVKPPSWKDRR